MEYTKAKEDPNTKWPLREFVVLHGNFTIIQEYETGLWCGRFNNRGIWTHTHIEKKVRGTPVPEILNNQEEYEVVVLEIYEEYCLCRKGQNIDYNVIYKDLNPYETESEDFNTQEYYNNNPDIFDGEVL